MRECEQTICINLAKLPDHCKTGNENPFMRLDTHQIDDICTWIDSIIPEGDFCAEIIGRMPNAVALAIGGYLRDIGCEKLVLIHPPGMMVVWDNTGCGE